MATLNDRLLSNLIDASLDFFPMSSDASINSLIGIAYALHESKVVQDKLGHIQIANRLLVIPSLERAYREMMYLRRQLPESLMDTTVITRLGRVVDAKNIKEIFTNTY